MTNVRPGDRAIVVRSSDPRNLGIVVDVIAPCPDGTVLPCGIRMRLRPGEVGWVVESLGRSFAVKVHHCAPSGRLRVVAMHDRCLRRLPRPDEMHGDMPAQDSQPVWGVSAKEEVTT